MFSEDQVEWEEQVSMLSAVSDTRHPQRGESGGWCILMKGTEVMRI